MAPSVQWGNIAPFLRVVFCSQQNLGIPPALNNNILPAPLQKGHLFLSSSILHLA